MHFSPLDLVLGLIFSGVVAWVAFRKNSLALSGFYAATILGGLIYLFKPIYWVIMIIFFISSSLLSKFKRQAKVEVEQDFAKDGRRDWLQVIANGVIGLAFAIAYGLSGDHLFTIGYIASFATVNADTWATEIGVLSSRPPVSILTFKPVTPGVSGAVSLLGTSAALAGAALIVAISCLGLVSVPDINLLMVVLAGTLGGIAGCLTDSILGATVQAMYRCQTCGKITERKIHHNQPTQLVRGWKYFHNDLVNLTSALVGGLLAMGIYLLWA